jgi:hypothetical protein
MCEIFERTLVVLITGLTKHMKFRLVNSAGAGLVDKPLHEMSITDWNKEQYVLHSREISVPFLYWDSSKLRSS